MKKLIITRSSLISLLQNFLDDPGETHKLQYFAAQSVIRQLKEGAVLQIQDEEAMPPAGLVTHS